jgi:hypothetical protein
MQTQVYKPLDSGTSSAAENLAAVGAHVHRQLLCRVVNESTATQRRPKWALD